MFYEATAQQIHILIKCYRLAICSWKASRLRANIQVPYTQNFSWHVYFTVKHGTRIFVVEILRMKIIQKFLRFLCHATKNLYYYFKRDRQSSLPNSISHVATVYASVLKNNLQMCEMTCSTWPIVVPYFHKPTM